MSSGKEHIVRLDSLRLNGNHGLFDEEFTNGNQFEFQLEVHTDFQKAMETDKIDGTLNYARLIEVIKAENEKPSKLLENLAYRVIKQIFIEFEMAEKIRLSITKLNPPLKDEIKGVGITIEESR